MKKKILNLKFLVRTALSQESIAVLRSAKGLFCSVPGECEHGSLLSAVPLRL